jgi:hypothetical protein
MPRLTIRTLMIAVAVGAIDFAACLWMHTRAASLHRTAQDYRERLAEYRRPSARRYVPSLRVVAYYTRMARKYEYAARYPWLPVEADPPEPEQ